MSPGIMPSRRTRTIGALIVASALGVALSGCTGPSLTFEPGQTNITPCADHTDIDAAFLNTEASANCNEGGRTVRFPDGKSFAIPSLGGSAGFGDTTSVRYSLNNLGTYGVVAARVNADGTGLHWWGTKRGLDEFWAAYGHGDPT